MRTFATSAVLAAVWVGVTNAHQAAWGPGMYCRDGTSGTVNQNSNEIVNPLYMLNYNEYWMHANNKCDQFPPPDGEFLELPAGGSFQVQIATNRAFTTYSYDGQLVSDWPNGKDYPDDFNLSPACITDPNLHTQNETMAAGSSWAISYVSDLGSVNLQNLAVFSVKYHTPWKRMVTYDVPANLPACPDSGCICTWNWVPNGCGEPNMYMQPFRCKVTNARSSAAIAPPQPPVWCEGDQSKCVQGSKQIVIWHQKEGNNVVLDGYDSAGQPKSPGYNMNMGFHEGAQNDIFQSSTPRRSGGSVLANSFKREQ